MSLVRPLGDPLIELVATRLRVLGQPVRLRLIDRLEYRGETHVQALADELATTQQNTSKHLVALRRAGILTGRQEGRVTIYALADRETFLLIEQAPLSSRQRHRITGQPRSRSTVVAARFVAEGLLPVLDIGCGEGELARHLPQGAWVGVDTSPTMVAAAPAGARVGDAIALPCAAGSFAGATLQYVLYHLDRPAAALAEARRVLRPGGLVVTAAPRRHDSPELAFALPERSLTCDAEIAPGLMTEHFIDVEVQSWDGPLLTLPDRQWVRDYLIGKRTEIGTASRSASAVDVPLTITKRSAMVWGRTAAPEAPASSDAIVGTHP